MAPGCGDNRRCLPRSGDGAGMMESMGSWCLLRELPAGDDQALIVPEIPPKLSPSSLHIDSLQKPSKQVLNDSNIASGVSKWVPSTLYNR